MTYQAPKGRPVRKVVSCFFAALLGLLLLPRAGADVLDNWDFETGDLSGWTTDAGPLTASAATNETFNRNYAARLSGSFSSASWITSTVSQAVSIWGMDQPEVLGFACWKTHDTSGAGATGYVQAVLQTPYGSDAVAWTATNSGWVFFELAEGLAVDDVGFESGGFTYWQTNCDHMMATVQTSLVDQGAYALLMDANWSDWSWNEVKQYVTLQSGDVVEARARIRVDKLATSGAWLIAGIKIEDDMDGVSFGAEAKIESWETWKHGAWTNLAFTSATVPTSGTYIFRCMVCGGSGGSSTGKVYFDEVELYLQGQDDVGYSNATLSLSYIGYSGGAGSTNTVDVYFDSVVFGGSTADVEPATNIFAVLRQEAEAIATNPAVDIPVLSFPGLYAEGYPAGQYGVTNFPAYVEAAVAGWRFLLMSNDVVVTATNTILTYSLGDAGVGFIEFDQYAYLARMPHAPRGQAGQIDTNAPHFALGVKDGSSAEFGDGPFAASHTYVVGTSLTNFPRRMTTDASGGWPNSLSIVFQENFSHFTNDLWNKHFVLATIPTNGEACNLKAVKLALDGCEAGTSNAVEWLSQELHLGWATEAEMYGKVDYPNCVYQDHNEVALRAPWLYNLLDDGSGWYMQQSPRGSATIEPMELFNWQSDNWLPRPYEEYLFTWDGAASGVRSLWDDDVADRLRGPVSYHIGFKVGHQYGVNEAGQPEFPEVINIRGNGYFRMTDYDGVMAGSFRPLAADLFALYQLEDEDAPLMPVSHVRVVPRTTPSYDDSYAQAFLSARSKSNNWFVSAMKADMHFAPGEVTNSGCYFDLDAHTFANRPLAVASNGPLCAFAQVSMHWRGGATNMVINDYTEAHDIDTVILRRSDGEWITHQVFNPPTNIYRRVLGRFASNDVVYLMQQDRAPQSYGYETEQPYRRASSFEITMLDDGGRDLTLDVYEQHSVSEINDNVDIAAVFQDDLSEGEELSYRYRYRSVYSPGVYIISPNETGGAENWSTNTYTIDFQATDGEDEVLDAKVYYGSGLEGGWTLINTNWQILVSSNTSHRGTCDWNVSPVADGAYYIMVTAQRTNGGKLGFDVSNTRLAVGDTRGLPYNSPTNTVVETNGLEQLGENMGFESGALAPEWSTALDDLAAAATNTQAYEGSYSACLSGSGWSGWSWNTVYQEIPCSSGEVLYVTGRVYVASFSQTPGITNWLRIGIKMESTNGTGDTEAWLDTSTPKSVWQTLSFARTVSSPDSEVLHLYVAGDDCTGVEAYFDQISVLRTGVVTTNTFRPMYWQSDADVDVSAHNALSFWISGTYGVDDLAVWAADAGGTTNAAKLTNFLESVISLPQRADVPWTNFATLDKTKLRRIGFSSGASSNDHQASRMRSLAAPVLVRSVMASPPQADLEGLPLFNPGQTATNRVTIENLSGTAMTGMTAQIVQEYAEQTLWWDASPDATAMWSPRTRPGERLCGSFEQVWTNLAISAGGSVTLTNVYPLPSGYRVDHTRHVHKAPQDWFLDRNYAARGRAHLVLRTTGGDGCYANDQIAGYAMDDNFDIDDDGLPDDFETTYSGTYTGLAPYADTDGDTFVNIDEYIAGTIPTSSSSYPEVYDMTCQAAGPGRVWFDSVTGREYWVECCWSLLNPQWVLLDTNLVDGDGGLMSIVDEDIPALTNRFYQLGVRFHHSAWPP